MFEYLKSKLLITFDLILCLNLEYLLSSKFDRVMEIGLFSWFFSDDNSSILRSFVKGWGFNILLMFLTLILDFI